MKDQAKSFINTSILKFLQVYFVFLASALLAWPLSVHAATRGELLQTLEYLRDYQKVVQNDQNLEIIIDSLNNSLKTGAASFKFTKKDYQRVLSEVQDAFPQAKKRRIISESLSESAEKASSLRVNASKFVPGARPSQPVGSKLRATAPSFAPKSVNAPKPVKGLRASAQAFIPSESCPPSESHQVSPQSVKLSSQVSQVAVNQVRSLNHSAAPAAAGFSNQEILALDAGSYQDLKDFLGDGAKDYLGSDGPDRRSLSAKVGASNKKFLPYYIIGDGDCALHALGVSRADFVRRLVDELQKDNKAVKELIYLAVVTHNADGKPHEYDPEKAADLVQFVLNDLTDQNYYLDHATIKAAALVYGKNVRIWEEHPNTSKITQTAAGDIKYNKNSDNYINLFHVGAHYDLLVDQKDMKGRLDASLREMDWTQMRRDRQASELK